MVRFPNLKVKSSTTGFVPGLALYFALFALLSLALHPSASLHTTPSTRKAFSDHFTQLTPSLRSWFTDKFLEEMFLDSLLANPASPFPIMGQASQRRSPLSLCTIFLPPRSRKWLWLKRTISLPASFDGPSFRWVLSSCFKITLNLQKSYRNSTENFHTSSILIFSLPFSHPLSVDIIFPELF